LYSHYLAEVRRVTTIQEALREERLKSLPLSHPACVPPGTSLRDTLRLMREEAAGCVLVCDGERLIGIFTERDVLDKVFRGRVDREAPIAAYMTRDPHVLADDATLGDAVRLMTERGYRHVPLVDRQGRRAGLIAARDIVHFIAEHFPAEVVNLPPQLHQTFVTPEGA
jgi:CBS domain-containing protein